MVLRHISNDIKDRALFLLEIDCRDFRILITKHFFFATSRIWNPFKDARLFPSKPFTAVGRTFDGYCPSRLLVLPSVCLHELRLDGYGYGTVHQQIDILLIGFSLLFDLLPTNENSKLKSTKAVYF